MNPEIYDRPDLLRAEIDEGLMRLALLVQRHDELVAPEARLGPKLDLWIEDPVPKSEYVDGMSAPDENGFVALEAVELARADAIRGDRIDREWARRIATRWAIQTAPSVWQMTQQQRDSVVLNCAKARFLGGIGRGGATLPMGQAFKLGSDVYGPRLTQEAVPNAAAMSSAMTIGTTVTSKGVQIDDVPDLIKRARDLFRVQNQHVRWGDD